MTRLLIATRNRGKLKEYQALLAEVPLELCSLLEVGVAEEIPETGKGFLENAFLKARGYAELSGLPTLADDSGLVVDALGGIPGVESARFGGPGLADAERYRLLLARMRDIPWEGRTAHFQCAIAVATPEGEEAHAEGECRGFIATAPAGEHGFGYDPIFYLPEFGCTMAQLPPEVKNLVSHRAAAARAILPQLKRLLFP